MALSQLGVLGSALGPLALEGMSLLPVLGAAVLLPSAMATALRLEHSDGREATPATSVDALLQRVLDGELDLGVDLDLDLAHLRNLPADLRDPDGQRGQSTRPPHAYGDDDDEEDDDDEGPSARPGLDTWSVVWYCGMFAAFTSLFLIMPCSQVLCRAGLLHGHSDPRLRPRAPLNALHSAAAAHGYATPPPPYKQFAPPAYEDVVLDLDFDFAPPGKAVAVLALPATPPPPPPPLQHHHQQQQEKDKDKDKDGSRDADVVYVIPLRPETAPRMTTTSPTSDSTACPAASTEATA